LQTLKGSECYC